MCVLVQMPSADDVVALKRELNQILVLMDETSSVHDKEKNMLAEDNRQMRSRYNMWVLC